MGKELIFFESKVGILEKCFESRPYPRGGGSLSPEKKNHPVTTLGAYLLYFDSFLFSSTHGVHLKLSIPLEGLRFKSPSNDRLLNKLLTQEESYDNCVRHRNKKIVKN